MLGKVEEESVLLVQEMQKLTLMSRKEKVQVLRGPSQVKIYSKLVDDTVNFGKSNIQWKLTV